MSVSPLFAIGQAATRRFIDAVMLFILDERLSVQRGLWAPAQATYVHHGATAGPPPGCARGETDAMTIAEKQGALLFFGAAQCSVCHSVAGQSNEMFSDFQEHVIGVPQIAPSLTNATFDGPGLNEDFGLEQVTGNPADRYKFRTSPLRNVAVQPTFMHNGAFTHLEDAIRHHLNVMDSALHYSPASQNLPADLNGPPGPMIPVLARLDPALSTPIVLTKAQFEQLLAFVRDGLLDSRATPDRLKHLVPRTVPSGRPVLVFEFP
ncbi:MAG: hypothetical protein ABIU05_07795 [Nitrospirales bacterium]